MTKAKKPKRTPAMIDEQLRTALRDSGYSNRDIARGAKVSEAAVSRFLTDDPNARRDLRLTKAAALARFLGLELAPRKGR